MAIAHVATEYVFSDFLLKEPGESKYKGVRLELAVDKVMTFIAVGHPLLLISLAFAQEVSVGTQISCFPPSSFSIRQAAYVDSFCWAAVQHQHLSDGEMTHLPLWLHKFFPYILLLVAIFMYAPSMYWRFTVAPCLFSDLTFIMEELDRTYNRTIKQAEALASGQEASNVTGSSDRGFRYPLVGQYLRIKVSSVSLVIRYIVCKAMMLMVLLMACVYLAYYVHLASATDEFTCDIRTGHLLNDSSVPRAFQCKLVAVSVFKLLSITNLAVYTILVPLVVYTAFLPLRQGSAFLRPYEMLPDFGELRLATPPYFADLGIYLRFLEENLSELKSYRCLQVLMQLEQEGCVMPKDIEDLLRTLGQVKTSELDNRVPAIFKGVCGQSPEPSDQDSSDQLKGVSAKLLEEKGQKVL